MTDFLREQKKTGNWRESSTKEQIENAMYYQQLENLVGGDMGVLRAVPSMLIGACIFQTKKVRENKERHWCH